MFRRFVHERIAFHRRYMELYHELVPSSEEPWDGYLIFLYFLL